MVFLRHSVLLKTGAFASLFVLAATVAITSKILSAFRMLGESDDRRPALAFFASVFKQKDSFVPYYSLLAALLFACVALFCIIYFFENTQSMEIRCFEIFAFSFTFEVLRIVSPAGAAFNFLPFYMMAAERILVFIRFAGITALLAAGLFASGFKTQQKNSLLLSFSLASLVIAVQIPIDIFEFDTALNPIIGFASMTKTIEFCAAVLAAGSFLAGAYSRGTKEFIPAGFGILLLAAGKIILQNADALVLFIFAPVMLLGGMFLFYSNMRKVYMWL